MRRKFLALLFGLLLATLALELLLQGLAWWQWQKGMRPDSGLSGARVLCVGDSYTYGVGASDSSMSYPAQAGSILSSRGIDLHVVNAGWPGQTSREVLLKLQNQLKTHAPKAVYILIGVNDLGARPALVTEEEMQREAQAVGAPESFPVKLRLLRLAELVMLSIRGGPAYGVRDEGPAFVGDWHAGSVMVTLTADGRLTLSLGGHPMWWYLKNGRLMLLAPGRPEFDADYAIQDGRLTLSIPDLPGRLVLDPGPPLDLPPLAKAQFALREGRFDEARTGFTSLLVDQGSEPMARLGLTQTEMRAGAEAAALEHVGRLRALHGEGVEVTDPLLRALASVGQIGEAVVLAGRMFASGGKPPIWELMNDVSQDPEAHRQLHEAIRGVIGDDSMPISYRAQLLRAQVLVLKASDPEAALRALLQAELLEPHPIYTTSRLAELAVESGAVLSILEALGAPPGRQQEIVALQSSRSLDAVGSVLVAHLKQMASVCRDHGTEPILITYPFAEATVERAMRTVSVESGVTLLPVRTRFIELLTNASWEDLFVVDGHCNDHGYRVIAEAVAADAATR